MPMPPAASCVAVSCRVPPAAELGFPAASLQPGPPESRAGRSASEFCRCLVVRPSYPDGLSSLPICAAARALRSRCPPERRSGPGLPGMQGPPRPRPTHGTAALQHGPHAGPGSGPRRGLAADAVPHRCAGAASGLRGALPCRRPSGPGGSDVGCGCGPAGPGHGPSDGSNPGELDRACPVQGWPAHSQAPAAPCARFTRPPQDRAPG